MNDPESKLKTIMYKSYMNEIKNDIKNEFNKNTLNFWRNSIREINYRDSASFFPSLNRIFRKDDNNSVNSLIIHDNEVHLLAKNNIDINKLTRINEGLLTNNCVDILDVIGSYFETVNSKENSAKSSLDEIVDKKAEEIKRKLKQHCQKTSLYIGIQCVHLETQNVNTIYLYTWKFSNSELEVQSIFDDYNKASKSSILNTEVCLTNITEVKLLLKKMSNKTSTDVDQIPDLVLKKITLNCIKTIL